MADTSSNDNSSIRKPASDRPDAHGQAAMLLVESLIHGLLPDRSSASLMPSRFLRSR